MHHTLQIPEIVANVFDYYSPRRRFLNVCLDPHYVHLASADLAALARTCRTFKEPALNVLWRDLEDLSPLIRCVPTALGSGCNEYSFIRPLTQSEWDVLRSYARRIRIIQSFDRLVDWESVSTFLNPPTTEPLFPNLRRLHSNDADLAISLLCLPFPSMVCFDLCFWSESLAQAALESLSKHSPNITQLRIIPAGGALWTQKTTSDYICYWQHLRSVVCPRIALDLDALAHLSRLPTLTTLICMLNVILPVSDASLVFSNLQVLELRSGFLDLISWLLCHTQLPILGDFDGIITRRPSRRELVSFFAAFRASGSCHTVEILELGQQHPSLAEIPLILDLDILHLCTAFSHLRQLRLDVEYDVVLTNGQLLALASEWPKLEELSINKSWGWNTTGGITPCGLVQLLKRCRSLSWVALRFDTQGFMEVPTSCMLENLEIELIAVYVLDSALEAESTEAITTFFCRLAINSMFDLEFFNWGDAPNRDFPNMKEYEGRWDDVFSQVEDRVTQHFSSHA